MYSVIIGDLYQILSLLSLSPAAKVVRSVNLFYMLQVHSY
jgi:hypothetical protein